MGNTTSKSKPATSKPTPSTTQTLCRLTEVKDTAEHIGSFLEVPDFPSLCRASKSTQLIFSKQLHEMALLKAVFDADPEEVQKILKLPRPPKSKCIVLAKTHIKETYYSPKLKKTGCKREWSNISPLEAAAWCGDIFLVRELLLHVPPTQKPEACRQLKGILDRKESEENGLYLAPYRALIQAYETYNGQFNTLYTAKNWEELKKLWNEVWQKQRLLPTYGLQEYCDDKPFDPPPSFTKPPKRSCYRDYLPKQLLDLDSMDFGDALHKGCVGAALCGSCFMWWGGEDLAAICRLCEVRTIDLRNTIKTLMTQSSLDDADSIELENPADKPGFY